MSKTLLLFCLLVCPILTFSQSISGIVNWYTPVTSINVCLNTITVDSTTHLQIGDTVVLLQMKGAVLDSTNTAAFGNVLNLGNAGNYEFNEILNISGTTITCKYSFLKTYSPSTGSMQLIRVPFFTAPTITGTVTCPSWDGRSGGVVILNTNGTLNIAATTTTAIDVSGKGFRGGAYYTTTTSWAGIFGGVTGYFYLLTSNLGANKGEGFGMHYGLNMQAGAGAQASGAGGGDDHNSGGGGGANFANGGQGGEKFSSFFTCPGPMPGRGGKLYTYNNPANKVFMGGGGGAGHDNNGYGTAGTNGAGIVIIHANQLNGANSFFKLNGIDNSLASSDGGGGGGAGGSLLFDVNTVVGVINVEAKGGKGSDQDNGYSTNVNYCHGTGGGGSGGFIWYSGATLTANVNLTATGGVPGLTINANAPANCNGSNNNATAGGVGGSLGSLILPIATLINAANLKATPDTTICSGSPVQLLATGAPSYTWSPATGLSCTTCANPIATAITTTSYIVSYGSAGCVLTDTAIITVNPAVTLNTPATSTICSGTSTTLTTSSNAASISWSPAIGLSCTNCLSPIANPTTTTTYYVTATNGFCTKTDTSIVTVVTTPTASTTPVAAVCAGTNVSLNSTGTGTYTWFPTNNLSCINCFNPVANPTTTTTYGVIVANGACADTAFVTVTIISTPVVNIVNSNKFICTGDTVKLLGTSSNAVYNWTPASNLSCIACNNPVATPASTVTYHLSSTIGICTGTDSVVITVTAAPTITSGAGQSVCAGTGVGITCNPSIPNVTWFPAATVTCSTCASTTAWPLTTTNYMAIVLSGTCSDTAYVNVVVNPSPTVSILNSNQTICTGDTVHFSSTSSTGNYSWSPAATLSCSTCNNPIASPISTTKYYLQTTAAGCNGKDSVLITVVAATSVSASGSTTICSGSSTPIASVSSTSTVSWAPLTGLSCSNCLNPTANPISTTTYIVTANNGACTDTAHVSIVVKPTPIANIINPNKSICLGDTVHLQSAAVVGSISWSPALGLSCTNCTSPIAQPTNTTSYTLSVTNNGCTDTDQVLINAIPAPNVNAGSDQSICGGGSVTLTATASVSGITWSPAANLSCTNCATTVASPPSTIVYIATASVSGCSRSDSLTVAVSPKPVVSAGPNKQFCKGATTFIAASSTVPNYSWSPVNGLSCTACLTPTVAAAATTTYTLIGFGVGGCSDTAQVVIKVNPIPFVDAGPDQTICEGNAVQMNATGTGNFIWTPNNGSCSNCANPIFTPSVSTSYAVSITDVNGCTNNDQLYVTVNKYPAVYAGPSVTINYGEIVTLSTNSIATTYCWSTEPSWNCFANTPSCLVAPLTTTTYYLLINQIQNPCGQAMDSLIVNVNYIDIIGVPNAFTPNSDGMDDYFFPFLGSNQLVVMHIYNRWGEIVYSTNDSHSLGWDGKFKGAEQPIGTYMYYIVYKKEAKNKIQLKGDITLIR